jgi:hypothetical protein
MFQEAGNEINFAANGTEIVEFRHQPAVGDNFYLLNHTNTGAQQGFSYQGTTTASSINLSTPGDTAPDYVVSCVNGTGCSARLNGDEGFARFTVRDNTAANLAFRFGNAGETTYIDLKPAALTGTQTITVPDTTGTILVGGGTNVVTLGSVAFASLPAGGAGQMIFCSDCDLGSTPCASTPGPGTLAVHNGAAWNCQ